MGKLIEEIRKIILYPMDTKKGLFSCFLFFLFSLYFIYKEFYTFFFQGYFILSILFIIFLLWWLVRRTWYSYWSNKLYVVFAVTIDYEDEKLRNLYFELINQFRERLKDYNLSKKIKIKTKPVDIIFSDHSAAEAKTKLNAPCSTLIISGLPITAEKETEFKFNFHYEFKYPDGNSKEQHFKKIFSKKVSKIFTGKKWDVKCDNIESKKLLYGNVFNVSTYILSLCMTSTGRADDAKELLKPAREECNKNADKIQYGPLIAEIRSYLLKINEVKFNNNYWSLDINSLKPLAIEMEKLDKYNYASCMANAIVSELEGDREKAKKYTNSAENYHPKNEYGFKFNYLYFYLSEGDYLTAVKVLNELKELVKVYNISAIINFLDYQYNKTGEPAILFNIGSIFFIWGEEKLGRNELKKFINKNKEKEKYNILVNESKNLLNDVK